MQTSFSDLEYAGKKKQTRRERFLAQLQAVTPWAQLVAAQAPFYPAGRRSGCRACRACTWRSNASDCRTRAKLKGVVHSKSEEDGFSAALLASPDVEHALAEAIAKARGRVGLTQGEVAQRMQTTQSNLARLEAGRTSPSTRAPKNFAAAIGARLSTTFEGADREPRLSKSQAPRNIAC